MSRKSYQPGKHAESNRPPVKGPKDGEGSEGPTPLKNSSSEESGAGEKADNAETSSEKSAQTQPASIPLDNTSTASAQSNQGEKEIPAKMRKFQ